MLLTNQRLLHSKFYCTSHFIPSQANKYVDLTFSYDRKNIAVVLWYGVVIVHRQNYFRAIQVLVELQIDPSEC